MGINDGFGEDAERKKKDLQLILQEIDRRKRDYGITTFVPFGKQRELMEDMKENVMRPYEERVRFRLYWGGNGSGKTAIAMEVAALCALGESGKKYGLPFIGAKKNIWVLTQAGSNVQSVIEPYLLGDYSIARIPPDEIEGVPHKDNKILKGFELKNGCRVSIKTYEQGREALQGGNPDLLILDEEPTNAEVFDEIVARIRDKNCEMVAALTPLSGLTRVYDFFFKNSDEEFRKKCKMYHVNSMDNPHTDKTWTKGLTEEGYRLRVLGSFEAPTGLVYREFSRERNVIPHIDPRELPGVTFYRGLDFGVSHPTAVVFVAVDEDENFYVFDEIYESNLLIKDLHKKILEKSKNLGDFKYNVADSAAKRERTELKALGFDTIPADKHSKGENEMSNRKWTIMVINQLLHDGKLFISDRCKNLINEFESHYYKDGNKDGEVIKTEDDLLDGLRYLTSNIKRKKSTSPTKREDNYRRKYGENLDGIKIGTKSVTVRYWK